MTSIISDVIICNNQSTKVCHAPIIMVQKLLVNGIDWLTVLAYRWHVMELV